jgi:hypothetical protein
MLMVIKLVSKWQIHRTDGPAIEYANGNKYWYINGIEYSEEDSISKRSFMGNII